MPTAGRPTKACSHYPQCFDDQREVEESEKHRVALFEPRKDAPESFQSPEEPLDFVALLVRFALLLPRIEPVGFGPNHGNHAQIEHKLSGFIAFVGAIHQHGQPFRHRTQLFE